MFLVSDELHDETAGEFSSLDDAVAEVRRLAAIDWDKEPNRAPCASWRTCGRNYEIVEFDDSTRPWRKFARFPAVKIDATGVTWADPFPPDPCLVGTRQQSG